MTTLIVTDRAERPRRTFRTVDVAGVSWPVYKVHAVIAGVVVGVLGLLITQSGQLTMWAVAAVVLAVWWGERSFADEIGRRRRTAGARVISRSSE